MCPHARLHLADLLDAAEIRAGRCEQVELQSVVAGGEARLAIFQHPPSEIRWTDIVPGERARLAFATGIHDTAWPLLAHPVLFEIAVADAAGVTAVFRHELDPRQDLTPRGWVPAEIDMGRWANASITLILRTSSPDHDPRTAWAAWADPILSHASDGSGGRRPRPVPRESSPPHIFLITADALRRDHLSCYGPSPVATPALDRLAADGLMFTGARAQSDATLASHVSLLTGRMPHPSTVAAEWGKIPHHLPSLPALLGAAGYQTVLVPAERELADERLGLQNWFESVVPCLGNPAQPADLTLRRFARWLDRRRDDRPIFAWIQLFEPHPNLLPHPDISRRYYPHDPRAGDRVFQEERIASVRAVESILDVDRALDALGAGEALPESLLLRLRDTAHHLLGAPGSGPDLASHLIALGPDATGGAATRDFALWLLDEIAAARRDGIARPALVAWLQRCRPLLHRLESPLREWLHGARDLRFPQAMYRAAVAALDGAIGQFLDALRESGRYDRSTIVATSPHGEGLVDDPILFEHHAPLEVVLRVPLIVKPPTAWGLGRGRTLSGSADLIDVAPSLLEWCGIPPESLRADGRSWAGETRAGDALEDRPSLALGMQGLRACAYRAPFKLVASSPETLSLYRCDPIPDETDDVSGRHPDTVAELRGALARLPAIDPWRNDHLPDWRRRIRPHEDRPAGPVAPLPPAGSPAPPPARPHPDFIRWRASERFSRIVRRDLERVSRLLDRVREALDRLYRSRRWRVANPLRNLDEQLRDTARARGGNRLAYRPLERAWTALRSAVTEIQQRALMFGESPDLAVYAWWLSTRRSASAAPVPAPGGGREISFLLVLPDDPRRDGSDLSATIHSVLGQTYPRWTLWLLAADRGRARDDARFPEDPRIRRIPPDATRETWPADVTHAAAIAPGDLLEPDALAAVARVAADPGSPDLIYTDEDRIDARGIPHDPFFKPAWSPDTLESLDCVGALATYSSQILQTLGIGPLDIDPMRSYEVALRLAELPAARVEHVAEVLYHRREFASADPDAPGEWPGAERDRAVLQAALARRGEEAAVEVAPGARVLRVIRAIRRPRRVAVIIPTRNALALLRRAVESVVQRTTYRDLGIHIVDNDSDDPDTLDYLAGCGHPVIRCPGPFNFAALMNDAVRRISAPWIVLLNNDTEVVSPDWIQAMAEHVQRDEIGAVGARLLYPDGTIQHAGVVLGIQGRAGHAFAGCAPDDRRARGQLHAVRNYSAVTAACMMVRRDLFLGVGGFDARRFPVAYNDVEFGVRLWRLGYRVISTPHAILLHHECASRPRADHPGEVTDLAATCLGSRGWFDPFYHPHLNDQHADFTLVPLTSRACGRARDTGSPRPRSPG